jgi:hypothetical protein
MIDMLGELLDLLLDVGLPSAETLQRQRQARLGAALFAMAFVVAAHFWIHHETAWALIVVGCALVAVWVTAFSFVDLVKELPRATWLSVVATALALLTLLMAGASWRLRP